MKVFIPLNKPPGIYFKYNTIFIVLTKCIGFKEITSFNSFKKIKAIEKDIIKLNLIFIKNIKLLNYIIEYGNTGDEKFLKLLGIVDNDDPDICVKAIEENIPLKYSGPILWQNEKNGNTILHYLILNNRENNILDFQVCMNIENFDEKIPLEYTTSKSVGKVLEYCTVKIYKTLQCVPLFATKAYFIMKKKCNNFYCTDCKINLPFTKQFLGYNLSYNPFNLNIKKYNEEPTCLIICGGGVKVLQALCFLLVNNTSLKKVKILKGSSGGALLICMLIFFKFNYLLVLNLFFRYLPILFKSDEDFYYALKNIFGKVLFSDFGKDYQIEIVTTIVNSIDNKIESRVFSNRQVNNILLIDILAASCCAPQIFSPKIINNEYYIDGGLTFNNPLNAKFLNIKNENILVIEPSPQLILSSNILSTNYDLLNKIFNTICLTKDTIANSNLHEDVKLFLTKENNLTQVCIRDNSLKTFETNSEKILCECTTFYNNCKVIKYNKI